MDEADDELRHVVARRGLGGEDELPRHRVAGGVVQEPVVEHHDVERQEQLALVLVEALDLDVVDRVGVEPDAVVALRPLRERDLVRALDRRELAEEAVVADEALEAAELVELGDPAVADLAADEAGEGRVGLEEPAARGDAVRHVAELLRPELVEVAEQVLLEDLGVELGDAVDGRGADHGEVGHAHVALAVLVHERHAAQAREVAGIARGDLLQEAAVDLVDDLQVARQQPLHHRHRPLLERLLEDGVVGVAGGAAGEVPRLVPAKPLEVDELAHQLGHHQRWVGVVELDEHLVRQRRPVLVGPAEAAQDVAERAGDEEVLLAEPELLAGRRVVVRVEDLGEVLGEHLGLHRLHVVALVEVLEAEVVHRVRRPESERVHRVAVADDRHVVGHALDRLRRHPHPARGAVLGAALDVAAEVDVLRVLGARHLPRIAVLEPVVRLLHLAAVDDPLAEDAIVVPEAVAHAGEVQGGHRVEVARREAAEAAVAEAGVGLVVAQVVPVDAVLLERVAAEAVGLEVDDVVAEHAPDEELERHVVDALGVLAPVLLLGADPALHDAVTHRVREGGVLVALGRARLALRERIPEVPGKILL